MSAFNSNRWAGVFFLAMLCVPVLPATGLDSPPVTPPDAGGGADAASFARQLDEAQARVDEAEARLAAAKAQCDQAAVVLAHWRKAFEMGQKSQVEVAQAETGVKTAQAGLKSAEGLFAQARARFAEMRQMQATALAASREPEWKAETRKALSRKVSFEFVDTPFEEALAFLRQLSSANFVVDPTIVASGKNAQTVSLHVKDMDLETALRWLCRVVGVEYELKDQAIFIFMPAAAALPAAAARATEAHAPTAARKEAPSQVPGGLVTCRLPNGLPQGLTLERLKGLMAVAAPKARVTWDEDLKFLLVAADETGEFARANMLLRELGVLRSPFEPPEAPRR